MNVYQEYRELYDPSNLNFKELEMERSTIEDEELAFQIDFQKDSYFGDLPSAIKFGLKYRSREVTNDKNLDFYDMGWKNTG